MIHLRHFVKFFLFGFILAAFLNYIPSCSEEKSPVQPEDQNIPGYSESPELKKLSDSLISAYKAEDKAKIIEFINEETKEIYANILNTSTKSLAAYGEALENRKLTFVNDLYAEYEITINEITYTFACANTGDGFWQLVRFQEVGDED